MLKTILNNKIVLTLAKIVFPKQDPSIFIIFYLYQLEFLCEFFFKLELFPWIFSKEIRCWRDSFRGDIQGAHEYSPVEILSQRSISEFGRQVVDNSVYCCSDRHFAM